jgi:hypothetical protein
MTLVWPISGCQMLRNCAQNILELLDDETLLVADEVSVHWKQAIIQGSLLQKLLKRKVCRYY